MISLVVCNRPDVVTKEVIDQFISLWKCKQFAVFIRPPSTAKPSELINESEDLDCDTQLNSEDQSKKPKIIDTNYVFSMILSPVYVFAQQYKPQASFDKLAELMTNLIKNGLMSIEFVNEQSMKLLRGDLEWNQVFN